MPETNAVKELDQFFADSEGPRVLENAPEQSAPDLPAVDDFTQTDFVDSPNPDPESDLDEPSRAFLQVRREGAAQELDRTFGLGDESDVQGIVDKNVEGDFQRLTIEDVMPNKDPDSNTGAIIRHMYNFANNVSEIPRAGVNGTIDALESFINLPSNLATGEDIIDLPQAGGEGKYRTITGERAHDIIEFAAMFGGAGRALNLLKAFKRGGATKGAVQGAIADFILFDEADGKLIDLITKYPAELEPVIAILRTNPNDPVIVAKAKAALEGTVLGAGADVIINGARVVLNGRWWKSISTPTVSELVESNVNDFNVLGDLKSEEYLIKRMRGAEAQASGKTPDDALPNIGKGEPLEEVYINFARINEPDDVKAMMQQMADMDKAGIDKARRGPHRTWEKVKLEANEVNEWKVLQKRMKEAGVALNDTEQLALRNLWVMSSRKLYELAGVASISAKETDLYNFRKMMAIHYTIQKEAIGARSEAARALAIWRMDLKDGGPLELSDSLEAVLQESGGKDVARKMAQKIAKLAAMDNKGDLNLDEFIEKTIWAKTSDIVAQVWINGLLSNPTTHMVNAMSNMGVIGQQILEAGAASQFRALIKGKPGVEGVQPGEAFAMVEGLLGAFRDQLTRNNMEKGFNFLPEDVSSALKRKNKIEIQPNALNAETFGIEGTNLGMAVDLLDKTTRVPGTMLQKSDEVFKSFGYRMSVHRLAQREAMRALNAGEITSDQFKTFKANLIKNPPESIRMDSVEAALYQTFTKDPDVFFNKMAEGVRGINGLIPGLGRLILPFKRTPINIITYGLERSPMAPMVSNWRKDIMAGGARADLAWTRMATGSMTIMWAMDLALSGKITGGGPREPGQRAHFRRTKQEYSVQIGDRWYSFNRADPIGMTLGFGADIAEILANSAEEDFQDGEGADQALAAIMFMMANQVTNKTYMEGIANLVQAMSDPERYGDSWLKRSAGSVIPSGVAAVARQVDPYARTTQSMIDAVRARTPGLSADLPLYRDFWGRPVDYRSGWGSVVDLMNPIYTKQGKPEPIDDEFTRLGYFPKAHPRKFTMEDGLWAAEINLKAFPHIYDRYVELINSERVHPAWPKGLKDTLNDLVQGKHALSAFYKHATDGEHGGKRAEIQSIINEYRQAAQLKIQKEFATELRPYFERNKYKQIKVN